MGVGVVGGSGLTQLNVARALGSIGPPIRKWRKASDALICKWQGWSAVALKKPAKNLSGFQGSGALKSAPGLPSFRFVELKEEFHGKISVGRKQESCLFVLENSRRLPYPNCRGKSSDSKKSLAQEAEPRSIPRLPGRGRST